MTRNCRKMIEQTGDILLLSKHSIQLSALFLLLSGANLFVSNVIVFYYITTILLTSKSSCVEITIKVYKLKLFHMLTLTQESAKNLRTCVVSYDSLPESKDDGNFDLLQLAFWQTVVLRA